MAGLLNTLKKNWRGLLDEVQAAPESLRALTQPAAAQQFDAALRNGGTIDKEKAVQMAMDVLQTTPMGVMGKIVYHGSPHKFDKFDMSKIGTGEGAQAYGHGLYMAETPEVADEYAGKLSKAIIQFKNKTPQDEYEKRILEVLQKDADVMRYDSRGSAVHQSYRNFLEPRLWKLDPKNPKANPYNKTVPLEGEELSNVIKYKEAAQRLGDPSVFDSGNFYKVDIPDEAVSRMLDWDKPLSEQPEGVINAISQIKKQRGGSDRYWLDKFGENPTGSMIVNELRLIGGGSFEKSLKDQGIPGIRYLDGMSRNAGQGSSNYVLFDDKLPRILERNGIPTGLNPWAPGEWRGLLEP